jgi:hypothetical protein
MRARAWLANLLCLGAAVLMAAAFFYPVWSLTARAVQYEREFPEGLKVHVYLSMLRGDLYEFEILNRLIGARFPASVPEQVVFPIVFAAAALGWAAAVFFTTWRRSVLELALALFVLAAVGGPVSLQWRLYAFGHFREPNPFTIVPDFTVPIIGAAKLYNWQISTNLALGAYIMALAGVLSVLAWVFAPPAGVTARVEPRNAP